MRGLILKDYYQGKEYVPQAVCILLVLIASFAFTYFKDVQLATIFVATIASLITILAVGDYDLESGFTRYFKITLPMITPSIFLNMVLVTINSFQVFDLVNVMTEGGPGMSTNVLSYRIYYEGFKRMNMGYASSIAYFLFALILAVTAVQFLMQKHWVHYD